VLGYDTLGEYEAGQSYFGALVDVLETGLPAVALRLTA